MRLFVDFFLELSIRRKRKELARCAFAVRDAVLLANRAVAEQDPDALNRANETISREAARYEVLFAELTELEKPDDVRRSATDPI